MVNNLLEISVADSTQNKYITYKYSIVEIYALMTFYQNWDTSVIKYPIINTEEEYRKAFPAGEKVYDDFIYAYEEDMKCKESIFMKKIYDVYF